MRLSHRLHQAYLTIALALGAGMSMAEMQALEDDFLSGVSGQSGITLDLETNTRVGEFAYFDDGTGIAFQGLRLGGSGGPDDTLKARILIDILADGRLSLDYTTDEIVGVETDGTLITEGHQARLEVEEIRFVNNPGDTIGVISPTSPSIGGLFLDFEIDDAWVELLKTLLVTVYVAYFGSRGFEKYQKIRK